MDIHNRAMVFLQLTEFLCLRMQKERRQIIEHSVLLAWNWMFRIKYKIWMRLDLVHLMAKSAFTGFVVDSDNLLICNFDDSEAYINDNWDDNRWHNYAFVTFRDCS